MIQRLVNPLLDKRAIAVIGVKFGGWGINRENMAIKIIDTKKKFLLIIFLSKKLKLGINYLEFIVKKNLMILYMPEMT